MSISVKSPINKTKPIHPTYGDQRCQLITSHSGSGAVKQVKYQLLTVHVHNNGHTMLFYKGE